MELRICHISDLHNRHKYIEVPECDILICSGDISGQGTPSEVENFLRWITKQVQATYKVFIAGNHDRLFDPKFGKREAIMELLKKYKVLNGLEEGSNTFYLENDSIEIMGVKIWGSPWTPWFHGDHWAFNAQRGEEIAKIWNQIPKDTDILITHGPAWGRGDYNNESLRVGCEDLRRKIREIKPFIHLFGHIHEDYGYDFDEHTYYFNGSTCNLQYEPVNDPYILDVDFQKKHIKILNNGYDSRKIEEDYSEGLDSSETDQVVGS